MYKAKTKIKLGLKIICVILFTAAFLMYIIQAHLNGYFFRKSPITPIISSIIGLLMSFQYILLDIFNFDTKLKKFIEVIAISNIVISVIDFGSFIIITESASMALSLLWLLPDLGIIVSLIHQEKKVENLLNQDQNQNSIIQQPQSQIQKITYQKNIYDTKTHLGRCKCCAFWSLFIFTTTITILYSVFAILGAYRNHKYPPIGQMVSVKAYPISQTLETTHKMRIYCSGPKTDKPTFLLEHGGGSNGIAFYGLQQILTNNGRRSCSYDRSGYGRSQSGPNDITPAQAAQKTYDLLNNAGELGQYIILGWSAGVQISQIFAYYHPQNTSGLIFVDGYPDYRALQAIQMNKTDAYVHESKKSLLTILDIIRGLQPLGTVQILGNPSEFIPESMKYYYNAYYKNTYTWNSQYNDIKNPNDLTILLTKLGDQQNSTRPYSDTKVSLNWPRIKVPLLILAAASTVGEFPNETNMYYRQCLKYNQTSQNATIQVLNGTHGIVYENPQLLANKILKYFL